METNANYSNEVMEQEVEKTPLEIAEDFVKENSSSTIIEEFVNHLNTINSLKAQLESKQLSLNTTRTQLNNWENSITKFLKNGINEDGINPEEIKTFAANMDIKLTKSIRVKFNVEVEYEFEVPLDTQYLNEDDFDIDISHRIENDYDAEETHCSVDVVDFESEEI